MNQLPLPHTWLDGFGDFARTLLRDWKVPGLSVAVVSPNQVLYTEGFGVRDVASSAPASSRTVFAVGSCTKAFTALGLGLLVDEGKLTWDTPVRDILPAFRLRDEVATMRATVRDLLCHRTGLPRHDDAWFKSSVTRGDMLARLPHLEPTRDFRSRYQYQNIMFLVAGLVIEALAGQSWEAFTVARILRPLDMSDTYTVTEHALREAEMALPYQEVRGEIRRIPFYAEGPTALGPAGHLQSNVLDMAKWLQFWLNGGNAHGAPLASAACVAEMCTAQVAVFDTKNLLHGFEAFGWPCYGLGWRLHTYRDRWLVNHGGAIDGFGAHASFMPEAGFGVVALGNLNATNAPAVAAYNLYDRLLGYEPAPWSERLRAKDVALKSQTEQQNRALAESRLAGTRTSQPLTAFEGEYEHPGYGAAQVTARGEGLALVLNRVEWALAHQHHDVFLASKELGDRLVPAVFNIGQDGAIRTLSLRLEPEASPIVFARRA